MWYIIAAAILTLLLLLPIGICASYNQTGYLVQLCIGPFRFSLYPVKKNKSRSKVKGKDDVTSQKRNQRHASGSIDDFLEILHFVCDVLKDFRRKIVIDHLRFRLILAGNDPCDLSINYGVGWSILGNIMPYLERYFTIKKRELEVECDYIAEQILVDACIQFHLTVASLLHFVIFHAIRYFKKYNKHIKQFKGGATT